MAAEDHEQHDLEQQDDCYDDEEKGSFPVMWVGLGVVGIIVVALLVCFSLGCFSEKELDTPDAPKPVAPVGGNRNPTDLNNTPAAVPKPVTHKPVVKPVHKPVAPVKAKTFGEKCKSAAVACKDFLFKNPLKVAAAIVTPVVMYFSYQKWGPAGQSRYAKLKADAATACLPTPPKEGEKADPNAPAADQVKCDKAEGELAVYKTLVQEAHTAAIKKARKDNRKCETDNKTDKTKCAAEKKLYDEIKDVTAEQLFAEDATEQQKAMLKAAEVGAVKEEARLKKVAADLKQKTECEKDGVSTWVNGGCQKQTDLQKKNAEKLKAAGHTQATGVYDECLNEEAGKLAACITTAVKAQKTKDEAYVKEQLEASELEGEYLTACETADRTGIAGCIATQTKLAVATKLGASNLNDKFRKKCENAKTLAAVDKCIAKQTKLQEAEKPKPVIDEAKESIFDGFYAIGNSVKWAATTGFGFFGSAEAKPEPVPESSK